MTKDAVATMGTILTDDVGGRDAVHVAVIAVTAAQWMAPAQDVGLVDGGLTAVADTTKPIGIVDPFLKDTVHPGQRFWLYLYPRTITSLRHNWTHPEFEDLPVSSYVTPATKLASELWLRNFAQNNGGPDYEHMIAAATGDRLRTTHSEESAHYSAHNDGEYLHFDGQDASGEIPPEFWDHVENVTGKRITKRPSYFSCSC